MQHVRRGGAGLTLTERRTTDLLADLTKPIDPASIVTIASNAGKVRLDPATSRPLVDITDPAELALAQRVSSNGVTVTVADLRAADPVLKTSENAFADALVTRYFAEAPTVSTSQHVDGGPDLKATVSIGNVSAKRGDGDDAVVDWRASAKTKHNAELTLELTAPPGSRIVVATSERTNGDAVYEVPASGKLTLGPNTRLVNGSVWPVTDFRNIMGRLGPTGALTITVVADADGGGPQLPKVLSRIAVSLPKPETK